ncbi:unnamed protein product [Orchesella dallaii]|uniref:Ketosynthase family 3 (KS3) domain-containing protein n=1 Tax=Orchesella dallaii TaxID=48710 RepID=A0ABP1QZF1_9HEXA
MRGSSFAWIILISKDEDIPQALLSAASLKRANASGCVVALVGAGLSRDSFSKLYSTFDWAIPSENSSIDLLFTECWKLSVFSGVVALLPGVLLLSSVNNLLDTPGLLLNEQGHVIQGIALPPSREFYAKLSSELQLPGMTFIQALSTISASASKEIGRINSYTTLQKSPPPSDILVQTVIYVEKVAELVPMHHSQKTTLYMRELEKDLTEIYEKFITLSSTPSSDEGGEDRICIVGMSCRFPGANNPSEFWELLISGRKVNGPKLKCRSDELDGSFFNMSPAEAASSDPQARLLLECSWEALEDAGINPEKLRGTDVGVFYGTLRRLYREMLNDKTSPTEEYLRKYLGNAFGSAAAKLSFFYGWTGPNIFVDNGESSTLVGLDLATKSLQTRESSVALVAGTNLLVPESEQGKAEGVGVLILKRYSDAVRDNDRIYGFVKGCGLGLKNNSGEKSHVTAMKQALRSAGVAAEAVHYVETQSKDDPNELSDISEVYQRGRKGEELVIGSLQTSIGNTEPVSGIAGIIKVLLSMKNEMIISNEKIVAWPRSSSSARLAGVSTFGVTGTDAHVILEEAELISNLKKNEETTVNNPLVIFTASGKTEQSVRELSFNFESYLNQTSDNICDIAYTSNACRAHHQFRTAFVGSSTSDILKEMKKSNEQIGFKGKQKQRICFVFPGITGKMNLAPIKQLYACSPYFQLRMDGCAAIVERIFGASMKSLLLSDTGNPGDYLLGLVEATVIAAQYCLAEMWRHWGISPDAVLGHCLGEVPAAIVSGILSIESGLEMIIRYMHATPNALPGAMLALNVDKSKAEQLITEFCKENEANDNENWLEIACINNDVQTTVAGSIPAINKLKKFCAGRAAIKSTLIPVDLAIHSRALEPVYDEFVRIAEKFSGGTQQIPYISSALGTPVVDSNGVKSKHYADCFRKPVDFMEACRTACKMEFDVYLEIGLDGVLSKITERNLSQMTPEDQALPLCLPTLKPLSRPNQNGGVLQAPFVALSKLYVKGADINWDNFYQGECHQFRKVNLPHYPFQRKTFWFETVEEKKKRHETVVDRTKLEAEIWGVDRNEACNLFG